MKKNKIYFDDFKKGATFINNNWNKINEWWYSKNVQKSRKKFLNQLAILNPNLEYDINKLIIKLK